MLDLEGRWASLADALVGLAGDVHADKLDDRTFGKAKTFATVSTPLTAVPSVEFVGEDGTILGTANGWKGWHVKLSADGTSLALGPVRGTICIFR